MWPCAGPRSLAWWLSDAVPQGGNPKRAMARSDLLVNLVKAGIAGDITSFRKAVDAVIAEERGKKHEVLADRLVEAAAPTKSNGLAPRMLGPATHALNDLCFEKTPRRLIEDLFLPDDVSIPVRELVEEQHRHDILRSHGLEPRHRILLSGEPGNGKTSLAEGIAHSLMVPLIVARYDGLIGSYLGETSVRLRRLFDHVRTRQCVLFFDEFDAIGKERGDAHETGEIKRVVSSLLLQIDDLPSHVVVVTATNHPELLDRAVWRRFQLRLRLPPPSQKAIEAYFAAAEVRLQSPLGVSAKTLADKLQGANFSELEDFVADISRRFVLSLPEANVKQIVQQRLSQWQSRVKPAPNGE